MNGWKATTTGDDDRRANGRQMEVDDYVGLPQAAHRPHGHKRGTARGEGAAFIRKIRRAVY